MTRYRCAATTSLLGLALLLPACGIPTADRPETIPASDVPYGLASTTPAPTPSPSPPPRSDEPRVYLVTADDVLVPRGRAVGAGSVEERLTRLLEALAAGPTDAELEDELTSALPPEVRLSLTEVQGDTAIVDLGDAAPAPSGRATRRAVGQLVLTATSLPGIEAVQLTRQGERLEAPLPAGELTSAPLTADDYAALLTSPPT